MNSSFKYPKNNLEPTVLFENYDFFVLYKPFGVVCETTDTKNPNISNYLLDIKPELKLVTDFGKVHRLDKDTTGLLLWAKTETGLTQLRELFRSRTIKKIYKAIVFGKIPGSSFSVDVPLERSGNKPLVSPNLSGKESLTFFELDEQIFENLNLLNIELHSGRMHQIRAHLKLLNLSILFDNKYGKIKKLTDFKKYFNKDIVTAIGELSLKEELLLISQELRFSYQDEDFTFRIDSSEAFKAILSLKHNH